MGAPEEAGYAQSKRVHESTKARPTHPLTWGEIETMDILNDAEAMRGIAASREDMKAGRVVVWKPKDAKSTKSI